MRSKLKTAVATLTFVFAFALVGSPSAPAAKVVPTVGGVAHAYAPCDTLFWNMMSAANAYLRSGTAHDYDEMIAAFRDWVHHCGA